MARAQIDPYPRSLLQLGYDQSLSGQGPQSLYAYPPLDKIRHIP